LVICAAGASSAPRFEFDIPAQRMVDALNELSSQSETLILFPYDLVQGLSSSAISGRFTVLQALDEMLMQSGLVGGLSEKGVLMISESETKHSSELSEGKIEMNTNKSLLAALLGVFAGAGGVQQGVAQTYSAKNPHLQIEEVIITAQKRSESLQDVPIAVTAFTGEALNDFGVSNTQSLQDLTPGLVFSNTGSSAQPFLRGVGTRLALNGLEPSVATYLDDRYMSRATASTLEFADVDRVEVLKGPQGTLYGRNATGGAIRVITKGVADELEGTIKADLGNYDYLRLSGTVSVPITEDLGVRFTALSKTRDGYADNLSPIGTSDLDDVDYQAFRTKVRWDISDSVTANLALNYWERDDNQGNDVVDLSPPGLNRGTAVGGISGIDTDEVATEISGKSDGDEFSGQLRFDAAFEHVDLVSITTFTDLEQQYITDGDGTSAKASDLSFGLDAVENYSQELQLLSNNDDGIRWMAGAFFFSEDSDMDLVADLSDFVADFIFSQGYQTVETTA